jgi:Mn2+/Fe2+ NRAMP family transporter
VSGESHALAWLLPALVLLGLPTLWVGWLSVRVAQASGLPYSRALAAAVGRPLARVEAVALYLLNGLILVTEFLGMTLALALTGLPQPLALALAFALVVLVTSSRVYPRTEALLLKVAAGSLLFLPALWFVHPSPAAVVAAFSGHAPDGAFLALALAGNAIPPWMIYWQQNAVWAGEERSPGQRLSDLVTGIVAMIALATAVLFLGALTPGDPARWASPVAWIAHGGGRPAGILFAVGLFDAGLLAACTVSLSSLWTLREALGRGLRRPTEAPNRGRWRVVHIATLAAAAAAVLAPGLSPGGVALWAQALGAVWMPVSLTLLGVVASSRRVMGARAIGRHAQYGLAALALAFAALAAVGLHF